MGFQMSGPGCCCESCTIFEDKFNRGSIGSDWDTISGSWSISSNALQCTTSGIILVATTYNDTAPTVVQATVGPLNTTGDKGRIIVAYTDSNNYLYAQLEKTSILGELKLFRVSGGSTTQLGTTRTLTNFNAGPVLLKVCYQDGILAANAHYVDNTLTVRDIVMSKAAASSGTRHGVAVAGGTVTFDDYTLSYHDQEQNGCPDCTRYCDQCVDDTEPSFYQVVISGVTGTYASCINGTYIVPSGDCGGTGPQKCAGSTNPTGPTVSIATFGLLSSLSVTISVPCGFGFESVTWLNSYTSGTVPCATFSNESVAYSSAGFSCFLGTDFSSSTCLVTAI